MTVDAMRSTEAPKINYDLRPPAARETQDHVHTAAAQRDLAYFSERIKDFAPTEGLFLAEDLRVELPGPETLKIGTVPPCLQKYDLTQQNASRGVIDDYFFYLDDGGIKEQAAALAAGTAYDPSDIFNRCFVRGLCEWFEGSNADDVAKDLQALIQEYADKLKIGDTPDIDQLQTKFRLSGEEATIGQIFKMRDTALAIRDIDYGSSVGTDMFITFARKGLMKAAAQQYADTLPAGLGSAFANRFTQLVDKNEGSTMQLWNNLEYCNGQVTKGFHNFLTNSAAYAYDLFSRRDGADLSSKVSQLVGRIADSGYYQPDAVRRYAEILSSACKTAMSSIS